MKIEGRWIAAAAAIVLTVIGLLLSGDGREETASTFGVGRGGYKALHDLLVELELPVRRSYLQPGDLPAGAVVWWLDAAQSPLNPNSGPCDQKGEDGEAVDAWAGYEWLEAGGTAVVFAGKSPLGESCAGVAGFGLPQRSIIDADGNLVSSRRARHAGILAGAPLSFELRGLESPRVLRGFTAFVFEDAGDWDPVAWIGEYPFILERRVGGGRLVAVADGSAVQNRWLAVGDAAPFVVDLVRRYGAPLLDENAHGFRPSQAALAYLAGSPARSVFAGLCLLGILVFWRGSLVPGRPLETSEPRAPSLDSYVDSMAGWYARTSDYGRVAARYREYALTRLRRHLRLPPEVPLETVAERLESNPRIADTAAATVLRAPAARTREELFAVAGKLDGVVRAALHPVVTPTRNTPVPDRVPQEN